MSAMKRGRDQVADELLVLLSQEGRTRAMNALASRWHRRFLAHAFSMTQNADEAADAVQEAWLAIVKNIRSLSDPAAFQSWAYRIVTHKCADLIRRNMRDRKKNNLLKETREPDTTASDSIRDRTDADDLSALRQAIDVLPIEHRTLLSMFYSADMSVQQIAAALRIPAGTVKSRLYHLRKELAAALEKKTLGKESL